MLVLSLANVKSNVQKAFRLKSDVTDQRGTPSIIKGKNDLKHDDDWTSSAVVDPD